MTFAIEIGGRVALGTLLVLAAALVYKIAVDPSGYEIGVDYRLYRDVTERWLSGGSFYQPWQLAGPYEIRGGPDGAVLYPPMALVLLVPFAYLPAALWWLIPAAMTVYGLWLLRPKPWTWIVILALAVVPATPGLWMWGNPGMWGLAGEMLGFAFGWPALLVLLKPSLAPFALTGIRHRSWWIGLAVLGLISLVFGGLWLDWWAAAIANPTNGGIGYSLNYLPVSLIPVVAWYGSDLRLRRSEGDRQPTGIPTPATVGGNGHGDRPD